jgi:hypothetical protein
MYTLRPLMAVVALGLAAGFASFAAAGQGEPALSTSQVVTTRADQNIYQQYGRDSVYGFSPDRKPQTPEHTAARAANTLVEGCC